MPFALAYRKVLACLCVGAFYTGMLNYLFLTGWLSVRPAVFIVAFLGLALPLLAAHGSLRMVLVTPLTLWCGFYAAITMIWFMSSSQSAVASEELVSRLLSVTFILTVLVILADVRAHNVARWSVLWSVLAGVGLNAYDLFNPLTFSPFLGRAAGLYMNPNTAAVALVLGMVLSVEVLPVRLRAGFVGLIGIGVLLTFSRSGALLWVLATGLLVGTRAMTIGALVRFAGLASVVVAGLLAVSGRWQAAVGGLPLVSSDAWGRLRLGERAVDYSAEIRLAAAREAWAMFRDKPIVGHGVGATAEWVLPESTHNIYLRHLAEYGVVGLAIVPLLAWSVLRRRAGVPVPRAALGIVAGVVVFGAFSHNVLDERPILIALTAAAAMVAGGAFTGLSRPDSTSGRLGRVASGPSQSR